MNTDDQGRVILGRGMRKLPARSIRVAIKDPPPELADVVTHAPTVERDQGGNYVSLPTKYGDVTYRMQEGYVAVDFPTDYPTKLKEPLLRDQKFKLGAHVLGLWLRAQYEKYNTPERRAERRAWYHYILRRQRERRRGGCTTDHSLPPLPEDVGCTPEEYFERMGLGLGKEKRPYPGSRRPGVERFVG